MQKQNNENGKLTTRRTDIVLLAHCGWLDLKVYEIGKNRETKRQRTSVIK